MERTKANQVARALNNLDSFEALADGILALVAEWDNAYVSTDFVCRLTQLLDEEQKRREKILEEM